VVARPPALAEGALTLGMIRGLLAEIVAGRVATGDEHLHLLDGTELFGIDDLDDLPDGLHPNAAGDQRMGERFDALAFGAGGPFAP
jgi:lysophospholipase L1-like esterase